MLGAPFVHFKGVIWHLAWLYTWKLLVDSQQSHGVTVDFLKQ